MKINFHQRPYDTSDRFWKFYSGQGDFLETLINRIQWYEYPKKSFVSDFPLHVDIETTSLCNMNCPMCFRKNLKELGHMEWDVFAKIIDECAAAGLYSVRLSWRGEALVHPQIYEMIDYAVKEIPNVSFLTNTYYITEEVANFLIEKQVAYLGVSFDGIGEVYNRLRAPAIFEDSLEKLRYLKETRDRVGFRKPQIRVCSIWPAISDDPQAYYDCLSQVSDLVVVNNYKDFQEAPDPVPDFSCQYPWERLMVAFNGRVQCCTGWNSDDISLGNIQELTLREMWHGEKLNNLRKKHRNKCRMEVNGCSICRHGNKLPDQNISIDTIIERRH
jgi:radical SAM protein with 4Fe4S-binding SPASM domain